MSDRTTMKQTVEQIAFADSTYWDDGWQFADHLQQKARNGLAREPAFRLRTAAEHLMADPDYNRMTDVERVAWLKGWDAAIEAEAAAPAGSLDVEALAEWLHRMKVQCWKDQPRIGIKCGPEHHMDQARAAVEYAALAAALNDDCSCQRDCCEAHQVYAKASVSEIQPSGIVGPPGWDEDEELG